MSQEQGEETLEEMVDMYHETIHSPPNAHGQHVHPIYGVSHHMLIIMGKRYGVETTRAAIEAKFQEMKVSKLSQS